MTADDVRELRARRNMTPTHLGKVTGLKRRAIVEIEAGREPTDLEHRVLLLAGCFDSPREEPS